jgi:tetratricopeptide (TPR) repeat protein
VKGFLRYFIFGVAAFLWLNTRAFGDPAADFDAANKLYEQSKFPEAAAAYEKLIAAGTVSPAIYFNLANAHFKAGEVGRAIAAYRQAERIAPRDPDVRANLQFVRNQVQGPTLTPGRWERWLQRLTLNEWTALASVALWIWLALLVVVQFRPDWKPALRSVVWSSAFAAIVLGAFVWASASATADGTAIVSAHEAVVRNGPFDESPSAFTVHDGAELNVTDKKDGWLQVSLGDRRIGWLKREQVVLSKETSNTER